MIFVLSFAIFICFSVAEFSLDDFEKDTRVGQAIARNAPNCPTTVEADTGLSMLAAEILLEEVASKVETAEDMRVLPFTTFMLYHMAFCQLRTPGQRTGALSTAIGASPKLWFDSGIVMPSKAYLFARLVEECNKP